jgi:hypothetical protein
MAFKAHGLIWLHLALIFLGNEVAVRPSAQWACRRTKTP